MVFGGLALVALGVFGYRVYREPRRVGNAVWLGVAAGLAGLWLLFTLAAVVRPAVYWALGAVAVFVLLVLPVALVANGVVMWRREGRRLANLLSLLAGVGALAILAVTGAAVALTRSRWVVAGAVSVWLVTGYFAFLFAALVGYTVVYGRLNRGITGDAIIVLGAGLRGDRVPPLLASRLDRAIACREQAGDADPVLVVSGGRGAGELVSEAEAMGGYLREHGVRSDRIVLEDQATTTEQNLRYSMAVLAERGHDGTTVAVTNHYHVFRTAVLSRRLKLPLRVVGAKAASYFVPSAFLREFVALFVQYRRANAVIVLVLAVAPLVFAALA
ncbi:YdcF family protein [Actinokineospora inagensis]|uniref:YdcF family protein n=1 Tax=Actinokineospora inagensis TaxID=103730 RepID=UPI000405D072|nr:YdcF family protein [Actinokineospora inagensis]